MNEENDKKDSSSGLGDFVEMARSGNAGTYLEKALMKMRQAMRLVNTDQDLTELARQTYADLSRAEKELGDDGKSLSAFFDMFHGLFAAMDTSDFDPDYEYVHDVLDDMSINPEFRAIAFIPDPSAKADMSMLKECFKAAYPEYRIILDGNGSVDGEDIGDRESTFHVSQEEAAEIEDGGFFAEDIFGNIVGITTTDTLTGGDAIPMLLSNTTEDLTDETRKKIEGYEGRFFEVFLAPGIGEAGEEMDHMFEKAEMAVRLAGIAASMDGAIAVCSNGRIYEKDSYRSLVDELDNDTYLPVDLFCYTYLETAEDGSGIILTLGLANYGYVELMAMSKADEVDREALFCAVQDLANYILQSGIEVKDGDILSYNEGKTKYRLKLMERIDEAIFEVTCVRSPDEEDRMTLSTEFHGDISYNRYEGITCPLSFFYNDRKNTLLFHIPGSEYEYSAIKDSYVYLLDNLSYIFEGIKDYFTSQDAEKDPAIRRYMRKNRIRKASWHDALLSLKPSDIYMIPTIESLSDDSPMLSVRYRKSRNSRSYIEVAIDAEVKLSHVTSV